MTNLNPVQMGFNRYCGPAVLSIVTGKTTDECAEAIAYFTKKYEVTGVYINDLKKAADRLGFNLVETPFIGRSLYSAITSIAHKDGIYVVQLERHYVCIEIKDKNVWFCDNHTKEPMPAASSARLMNGVVSIHRVEAKPKPKLLEPKYKTIIRTSMKCEYCGGESIAISGMLIVGLEKEIRHYSNCEYKLALDANK